MQLFIEEAREELAKIASQFPAWDQNPLEQDVLVTLRRSFHTLKGSGRMVGARELSEFAWASENLLNRLLDNTLTRSAPIVTVLRETVAALPELIVQLESGTTPQSDIAGIVARAHALAATRPVAPRPVRVEDRREAPHQQPPAAEPPSMPAPLIDVELSPQESASEPQFESPADAVTEAASFAEPASVEEAQPTAEDVEPASSGPDEILREIYARETSAHAAVVRAYIERERRNSAPHVLTEELYRACHTLSGSSKMAEARHGIRLAEPLDHWLRKSFNSGVGLRTADLTLLSDCMDAMESVAAHLDESTGYFFAHDALHARIADAESHLDQRIAEEVQQRAEAERGTVSVGADDDAPEPELAAVDATGIEVVELDVIAETDVGGAHVAEADTGQVPALQPSHDGGAEEPVDYDSEVASIFVDEALELLDASQASLAAWRQQPNDAELRDALKRPLHTLKGGARMAGITAMGDLSHELETLVMQIDSGAIPADETAFELMQSSLDELARLRELVVQGRPAPLARGIIGSIHGSARPGSQRPAGGARPRAAAIAVIRQLSAHEERAAPVTSHPEPVEQQPAASV